HHSLHSFPTRRSSDLRHFKPSGLTSRKNWYDILFCGHDWQVSRKLEKKLDAVYTYEDGAKLTFEAAKRLNIAKIYELPAGYYLRSEEHTSELQSLRHL